MGIYTKSFGTAGFIAASIMWFTIGFLGPKMPREVSRPDYTAHQNLKLAAAEVLQLNNQDGVVRIATHTEDTIRIAAELRGYSQHQYLKQLRDYIDSLIEVQADERRLRIITEPRERPDEVDLQVDYVITVPKGTSLVIEGSNGNIWVGEDCGEVSIFGINADIEVLSPRGPVSAKSTNGRIKVLNAPDETMLETVNGSIYSFMTGGALQASTTNGAIETKLVNPEVIACDLTSLNGSITIQMTEGCSAQVSATTGRGEIRSDLTLDFTEGIQRRRELQGAIGRGHTELTMSSMNGNIFITRSDS